jgi:hypothetical protein
MEELEWYGLSVDEAKAKYQTQLLEAKKNAIVPLKHQYRMELIQKLRDEELKAAEKLEDGSESDA